MKGCTSGTIETGAQTLYSTKAWKGFLLNKPSELLCFNAFNNALVQILNADNLDIGLCGEECVRRPNKLCFIPVFVCGADEFRQVRAPCGHRSAGNLLIEDMVIGWETLRKGSESKLSV